MDVRLSYLVANHVVFGMVRFKLQVPGVKHVQLISAGLRPPLIWADEPQCL